MKTVYSGKGLTIRVPTTETDWLCLLCSLAAIYLLIAGNTSAALDMLQMSLLFEILGRLPESADASQPGQSPE